MKGNKMKWFKDSDRDKVINIFDCKPHNKRKQGWAHEGVAFGRERTTHIKMMKPRKFLKTTYRELTSSSTLNKRGTRVISKNFEKNMGTFDLYQSPGLNWKDQDRVEQLKQKIKDENVKMQIPFLIYDKRGYPISHEGRHRATAAEELGIKLIPVSIARGLPKDDYRDWKDIRDKNKAKSDWKKEIENEKEVISSASADIPLKEQQSYGKERPETLSKLDED